MALANCPSSLSGALNCLEASCPRPRRRLFRCAPGALPAVRRGALAEGHLHRLRRGLHLVQPAAGLVLGGPPRRAAAGSQRQRRGGSGHGSAEATWAHGEAAATERGVARRRGQRLGQVICGMPHSDLACASRGFTGPYFKPSLLIARSETEDDAHCGTYVCGGGGG